MHYYKCIFFPFHVHCKVPDVSLPKTQFYYPSHRVLTRHDVTLQHPIKGIFSKLFRVFVLTSHNSILNVNKQLYSMIRIVSVTQYVVLMMLKWCNLYEFYLSILLQVQYTCRETPPIHSSDWL